MTETAGLSLSLKPESRWTRRALDVLTFSPAHPRVAPKNILFAAIHGTRVSVSYGSALLSRSRLRGSVEYSFEGADTVQPANLLSALSSAVNELGVRQTKITLGIPKSWTVIKTADFPSSAREDLANAVRYELDRFTPFSREDALFDFSILQDTGTMLRVMIAAVSMSKVRPYIELLAENGFEVTGLTVNLLNLGVFSALSCGEPDIVFVSADSSGYEGTLIREGKADSVFAGSFSSEDPGARAAELAAEIRKSSSGRGLLHCMALLTGISLQAGPLLGKQHGFTLQVLGEPDLSAVPGYRAPLPSSPPGNMPFVSVAGIVHMLRPSVDKLNLLSGGNRPREVVPILPSIALGIAALGMVVLSLMAPLRVEKMKIAEITRLIEQKKSGRESVETLKKETAALKAETESIDVFKSGSTLTLDVIREITALLPEGAWLTRLKISGASILIEGFAKSASEIITKLEGSPFLMKVEYASPTFHDARTKSERFVIQMSLEKKPADVKEGPHEKK